MLAVGFSRLNLEEQMRQQALHDSLTGLANRTLCRDRILHALAVSEREGGNAAVLFVDVDNFKRVNDVFGHAAGDELLIALAERMVGDRAARRHRRAAGRRRVRRRLRVGRRAHRAGARLARGRGGAGADHRRRGTEHQLAASIGIALGSGAAATPTC